MTTLLEGDCRQVLLTLPDNSVDSIVTDPPYELGFMGKSWDSTGIAYDQTVWTQCLRVLKPGGHLLSFGGTRTYHRMVCAIEDAGFEIRDEVLWIYGQGFPKSLDISKAIDKAAGAEREVAGEYVRPDGSNPRTNVESKAIWGNADGNDQMRTAPSTPAAHLWQGWGTALKPAHEPICLARKPIEGTVANNVLKWGVGGINVDGCRIEADVNDINARNAKTKLGAVHSDIFPLEGNGKGWDGAAGRWPANVITDGSEEVVKMFPQTMSKWGESKPRARGNGFMGFGHNHEADPKFIGDTGSACRFFYSAKASGEDRNEGLEGFEERQQDESRKEGNPGGDNPRNRGVHTRANNHPTVKPVDLMCYLCRLITPKGGTVLDPFMGSGSTGKAAQMEGFSFIGIELDPEYMKIARARIGYADNLFTPKEATT